MLLIHIENDTKELLIPSINLSASTLSFDDFLQDRPTQDELYKHITLSDWQTLAIFLQITKVDVDIISEEMGNIASLALQRTFQLWLKKSPNASRRKVIETLDEIQQHKIAMDYRRALNELYGEFINCNM